MGSDGLRFKHIGLSSDGAVILCELDNGRTYSMPLTALDRAEDWNPDARPKTAGIIHDGYAAFVKFDNKITIDFPADFVLHICEPSYTWYKDKGQAVSGLGSRIREIREARGLTLDALAAKCLIAKPNLSRLEHDKVTPKLETLQAVAAGLGVHPSLLAQNDADSATISKQEASERLLGFEYLLFKGAYVREVLTLSQFRAAEKQKHATGPDLRVACTLDGRSLTVGIELAEYHSDKGERGSLSKQAQEISAKLSGEISGIHFKQRPILKSFQARIEFDVAALPLKKSLPKLADQIADFVVSRSSVVDDNCVFDRGQFNGFEMLKKHVLLIVLHRRPSNGWKFGTGGNFGFCEKSVQASIEEKKEKAKKYSFEGMDESWLLIHASGGTSGSNAGPQIQKEDAAVVRLRECAAASGFTRVIFWDRSSRWDFEIPQDSEIGRAS